MIETGKQELVNKVNTFTTLPDSVGMRVTADWVIVKTHKAAFPFPGGLDYLLG